MTNKDLLSEVQKSCHLEFPQCLSLNDNLQKMLGKAAVEQIPVRLKGLGVFVSHKHPEYIQEDSQTGAMTLYPPRISYRLCTDEVEDAVSASLLLSEYAKVNVQTTTLFLDSLVSVLNLHLEEDEDVEVPGIGVFRNVKTHQSDLQHLSYFPDPKLKELVNTPFSCFEPFVISEGKDSGVDEYFTADDKELEIETEETENKDSEIEVEEKEKCFIDETPEKTNNPSVEDSFEDTSVNPKEDIIVLPVEKKQEEKKKQEDASNNYLLYCSLILILLGCGFLFWLIFADISFSGDDHLEQAVLSDAIVESPVYIVDSIEKNKDTMIVTIDSIVDIKEKNSNLDSVIVSKPVVVSKPEVKEFHRLLDTDGQPKTVTLQPGERLTLVALSHFGDKAFWPYVFEVNKDKLKAPNLVQAGMKLYLPDPNYYHIDANDPESLRKAKNLGAQLLK